MEITDMLNKFSIRVSAKGTSMFPHMNIVDKRYARFLVLLALAIGWLAPIAKADDFDVIMGRMRADLNTSNIHATDWNSGGYWTDIDYSNEATTSWAPILHLERLVEMATYYVKVSDDVALYNRIVNACNFWVTREPHSANWWWEAISVPKLVGQVLVLMEGGTITLPPATKSDLVSYMEGLPYSDPRGHTGANKSDTASHWLYRGVATRDAGVTDIAVTELMYAFRLTTGEGLQHDYSNLAHGPQLYIGGYGTEAVRGVVKNVAYISGTAYAPDPIYLDNLSIFIRNSFLKVIRGKYMHFNVTGRGVSRVNALNMAFMASYIEKMKTIDPSHAATYQAGIDRLNGADPSLGITASHKHYWRADYSLHVQPEYSFDVRMVSTRTERNEHGNGENLKGYFLADGGTHITVDGDEYYNLFPAWDWSMIPGTTTPHLSTVPLPAGWGTAGQSTYAGGVSDGQIGISAFKYSDEDFGVNTYANKSWFFFGSEVLCMGSGVTSANATEVRTTLNQCRLKGDVTISYNGSIQTLSKAEHALSDQVDWVHHNKVGYAFPGAKNISIRNNVQSGAWHDINQSYSGTVTTDVFKLWNGHGETPQNDTYQYLVVPGLEFATDMEAYTHDHIEIAACTKTVHAVRNAALNKWFIVFFSEGSFTDGLFTISVDRPCTMILGGTESPQVTMRIASPDHANSIINVTGEFPRISGTSELTCTFPVATESAGQTLLFFMDPSSLINSDWEANSGLGKMEYTNTAGWSEIAGWTADGYAGGISGQESSANYGGGYYCYGQGTGGTVFQTPSETIVEGETYTLNFDAFETWANGTVTGELYYVDGGDRVVIAGAGIASSNAGENYEVQELSCGFVATAAEAGHLLGVQFTFSPGWSGFDNVYISSGVPLPPYWIDDPVVGDDAIAGHPYAGTLNGKAVDPNSDLITYSKSAGPAWLTVAPNGALGGTPPMVSGTKTFTVTATADGDATDATLNITISIPITVENYSFELPDGGKVEEWSSIPGWDLLAGSTGQSGVDNAYSSYVLDGTYEAWFGDNTGISQLTGYSIIGGDTLSLSVDVRDSWYGDSVVMELYYNDAGTDVSLGVQTHVPPVIDYTETTFVVSPGAAAVGKDLGVKFYVADGWIHIDNVRLNVVQKPVAVADLAISSPISGGTAMVLSWTSENWASYGVETNSDLIIGDWQTLSSGLLGDGEIIAITNAIGPDQLFYRVITE